MVCFSSRVVAFAALSLPLLFFQTSASPVERRQSQDPNDDSFYAVPSNIGDYANGQIISTRSVLTKINAPGSPSYQILFRTNGKDGEATATVATIWSPFAPAPGPPQILAYQFAEDADNLDCDPSWAWVQNSGSHAQSAEKDLQGPVLIPWALDQGYYVVSTDAEGPLSAFLVGKIEGQAVVDAAKATINHYGLTGSRVALYGYSGGAHTTAWAATVAATEDTGLNIVGAAFGGTPIDLGVAFNALNNGPMSLIAGAALFGLANGYPELNDEFNRLLTDEGKQIASDIRGRNNCTAPTGTSFDYNSIFNGGDILNNAVLKNVLQQESLLSDGVAVPKFPRLQYHGTEDKTVPYQPEADYVQKQCSQGANIAFVPISGQDHAPTAILGLPGALGFVKAVLAGGNPVSGCGSTVEMPAPGTSDSASMIGADLDKTLSDFVNNGSWTFTA